MSKGLDWRRAKSPRPTEHHSTIWAHDALAKRARRELAKWKANLPRRQRRRLEAPL
jgi:hypothetical protein